MVKVGTGHFRVEELVFPEEKARYRASGPRLAGLIGPAGRFTTHRHTDSISAVAWTSYADATLGILPTIRNGASSGTERSSHQSERTAGPSIPAAAWLFGAALLGVLAVGHRHRTRTI
jgi:hypothetical protein